MRAIMPLYLFGGPGIAVRGVLLPLGATVPQPGPMTVDAPLTYTPQFGPFVRYSQHTNDESGDLFSYQSLMPAGAGTPRYEN